MPFHDSEIDIVIRDYICAICYGDLHRKPIERKWLAICEQGHNVERSGRVTRKWAEQFGQKMAGEALNIRVKEQRNEKPVEQILEELGF